MRTYAIGDVHGMVYLLRRLISRCLQDGRGNALRFVMLGDYVDRGADAKEAVQQLLHLQKKRPAKFICLRGNHEALLLAASEDAAAEQQWLRNGGAATLRSYGVEHARDLPAEHLEWLKTLPTTHDDGLRLFVHAGIDPGKSIHQQAEHDLLWIRDRFLKDKRDHGRFVVHGHTPLSEGLPDLHPNRVNLDTGAGYRGPLTAAVFDGVSARPIRFIQAVP
ncbi:metallophosphoesterase family protein [Rhodoplanes azumiensis]|uniref:Metallophosphoesterase family protein n=1 Tax=Rhodoplanes azumiensis TaxID=1897628 RepID=A0ABW5AH46_9BRAD